MQCNVRACVRAWVCVWRTCCNMQVVRFTKCFQKHTFYYVVVQTVSLPSCAHYWTFTVYHFLLDRTVLVWNVKEFNKKEHKYVFLLLVRNYLLSAYSGQTICKENLLEKSVKLSFIFLSIVVLCWPLLHLHIERSKLELDRGLGILK